jgi:2-C-methyl-D-erythritol 4-phosphate cytidylyltransferase
LPSDQEILAEKANRTYYMKATAIVVAAGQSRRLPAEKRKPFINLNNKPILIYALEKLASFAFVKNIIVVVNKKDLPLTTKIINKLKIKKKIRIVEGRKKRSGSVYQGLKKVPSDSNYVIVHDAVRPFFNKTHLRRLMKEAQKYGAAIPAYPVKPTIKEVTKKRFVKKTLDRKKLWQAQTPQVFKKDILLKAYRKAASGRTEATDDASLVEKLGIKVKVVSGDDKNIKITTPLDLSLAEVLIREKK